MSEFDVKRCPSCGGLLLENGKVYQCRSCQNTYPIDLSDNVHAVQIRDAWEAFENQEFDKAIKRFEALVKKEPDNSEWYWGLAISDAQIRWEEEYKKIIPTFHNIKDQSFIKSRYVEKAIALAPDDEKRAFYQSKAEEIERVRIEWLALANKQEPYDIFISFKATDEDGNETPDSRSAQNLYTQLVHAKYNVFFSAVSLKSVGGQKYEPYIYNAIRTAKVMIVYGEKAEYFESKWIKNEWERYQARIAAGEKRKDSLLVVQKGVDPYDIPKPLLGDRQAFDYGDITFLSDLTNRIKNIMDEYAQNEHVQKIHIASGQRGKKASVISANTVSTRSVGGAGVETSINEKQTINLISKYLKANQWADAEQLINDMLAKNHNCAEAIWSQFLLKYRVADNKALTAKIRDFTGYDYQIIDKTLGCASVDFAQTLLSYFYGTYDDIASDDYAEVLKTILVYGFSTRSQCINTALNKSIAKKDMEVFNVLIGALDSSAVDEYIDWHVKYIKACDDWNDCKECANKILEVDESNAFALSTILNCSFELSDTVQNITENFENLLKFAPDDDAVNREVIKTLDFTTNELKTTVHCEFAKQVLRYYKGNLDALKPNIHLLAKCMLQKQFFEYAQYLFELLVQFDPSDSDAYWNVCLSKTHATSNQDVLNSDILLSGIPEFNKFLTLLDDGKQDEFIALTKKQKDCIDKRIADRNKREKEAKKRKKQENRRKARKVLVISLVSIFVALIAAVCVFVATNTYSIEYDLSGGEAENIDSFFILDKEFTLNAPVRKGYIFVGWRGTGISDTVSKLMVDPSEGGDRTYTAVWQPKNFILTYDADGGICETTSQTVEYDQPVTLATPVKTGFVFDGWYIEDVKYTAIDKWEWEEDLTLVAKWVPSQSIPYKVNYYLENVSNDEYTLDKTVTFYGTALDYVTPIVIEYNDYVSPDGQSVQILTDGSAEVSYYYKRVTYTIDFVSNSLNTTDSLTVKVGSDVVLPDATRDGYTFGGWYVDEDLQTAFDGSLSKDSVLYAYWVGDTKPADLEYTSDSDVIVITGYKGTSQTLNIPAYIAGQPVQEIGECAFRYNTTIVSVIIPETVTKIGYAAFNGCTSLVNLTIPFVGESEGANDASNSTLGHIFGDDSPTNSYNSTVYNDTYVTSSNAYATQGYYSSNRYYFAIPKSLKNVTVTVQTTIPDYAFACCDLIESVTYTNTVGQIGTNAFELCTASQHFTLS